MKLLGDWNWYLPQLARVAAARRRRGRRRPGPFRCPTSQKPKSPGTPRCRSDGWALRQAVGGAGRRRSRPERDARAGRARRAAGACAPRTWAACTPRTRRSRSRPDTAARPRGQGANEDGSLSRRARRETGEPCLAAVYAISRDGGRMHQCDRDARAPPAATAPARRAAVASLASPHPRSHRQRSGSVSGSFRLSAAAAALLLSRLLCQEIDVESVVLVGGGRLE